jgi:hypothetical protein
MVVYDAYLSFIVLLPYHEILYKLQPTPQIATYCRP